MRFIGEAKFKINYSKSKDDDLTPLDCSPVKNKLPALNKPDSSDRPGSYRDYSG